MKEHFITPPPKKKKQKEEKTELKSFGFVAFVANLLNVRPKKSYFSSVYEYVKLPFSLRVPKIVYYVMRSKNEVLCAAAAKAHKTIFARNNIYYFFFKPS
jgi:hypothetical protein